MTEENVREQLGLIIEDEYIVIEELNNMILVSWFVSRFGESDLTYDSLVQNPNTTEGWKSVFKNWQDKGYIV